jgi:cyanophycinase-like exopeptidase
MNAPKLTGRCLARSKRRPDIEALEVRFCLSTGTFPPASPQAPAGHLGPALAGSRLHPMHSGALHHETNPGGRSPALAARGSASAQRPAVSTSSGGSGWVYTREGSAAPVTTPADGGLALEGGGTDIDQVFQWMRGRMGGTGDFLVIRATNDTGYNDYLFSTIGGFNSVATLDIPNRAAANDPAVKAIIESADAVFIGGGNQADYVTGWQGTAVETAIQDDVARGVPLGGTSAGTDVIGQFIYSALHGTISSAQALTNPFDNRLTLDQDFVDPSLVPFLNNTIVDTHFVTRDRMGRMLTFLARIDTNGWSAPGNMPRGIGINEQTALEITPDGKASVVANAGSPDPYAYFLQTPGLPQVCQKNVPLTYDGIAVDRVAAGGNFNLNVWRPTGAGSFSTQYVVSASSGVLSSNQAGSAIY